LVPSVRVVVPVLVEGLLELLEPPPPPPELLEPPPVEPPAEPLPVPGFGAV